MKKSENPLALILVHIMQEETHWSYLHILFLCLGIKTACSICLIIEYVGSIFCVRHCAGYEGIRFKIFLSLLKCLFTSLPFFRVQFLRSAV